MREMEEGESDMLDSCQDGRMRGDGLAVIGRRLLAGVSLPDRVRLHHDVHERGLAGAARVTAGVGCMMAPMLLRGCCVEAGICGSAQCRQGGPGRIIEASIS
jgi:hypothetical protein